MANLQPLEAKNLVAANLLQQSGISGVGLDPKPSQPVSIIIYVKDSATALKVPSTLAGYQTRTIITGDIHTFQTRPVTNGTSISTISTTGGTGSYGTTIYEVGTGKELFLSCWHVLDFNSPVNEPIISPGLVDNGVYPADQIGNLYKSSPISYSNPNLIDAALAVPTSSDLLSPVSFTGIANPVVNSTITKVGRTTGKTSGMIQDISATMRVSGYPSGSALFDDCVVTGPMSQPGDSGSVGYDSNNNAVGILFAGSDTITIYNKMTNVASLLNVTMNADGTSSTTATTPVYPSNPAKYLVPIGLGIGLSSIAASFLIHR